MKRLRTRAGSRGGLDLARLVVDLGGQQHRAAGIEAAADELLEMGLVANPGAVGDAGAARHRHDVGPVAGRGRLLAGDLVDAVVPDDDGQVARRHRGDGGEAAERHQERAVAFERDHAACGCASATPSAIGQASPMLPSM